MHAPQRGAYACRMRWIIDADPCKRRLSEPMVKPMVRIHRAAQAICRAKRSLQPFARATAAGPAPPHRRRLPRALPTSSFRHAPAYTWSWGLQSIEPSGSCYKGQCPRTTVRVRASSCSCSEACSCVTATGVLGGRRLGWGVHERESLRADDSTSVAGVPCAKADAALAATNALAALVAHLEGKKARTRHTSSSITRELCQLQLVPEIPLQPLCTYAPGTPRDLTPTTHGRWAANTGPPHG